MGATVRCMKCNKGISDRDKWVVVDDDLLHFKCAKRLEKAR
jgi:hypothetical protein